MPYIPATVIRKTQFTPSLFSLTLSLDGYAFRAGQFASLALPARPEDNVPEDFVARPYSFVNPPGEALEFLITAVEGGIFSPRLSALAVGDTVSVGEPFGFLTCDDLPDADNLWMIATGTGVAPFLSLLRTDAPWQKFRRIVLVHGTRHRNESISANLYRDVLTALTERYPDRFDYVSCVTRDAEPRRPDEKILPARITAAIENGALEQALNLPLTAETAQVMLCGNPAMIEDTQNLLKQRGMKKHRSRSPGQITVEKYW
jgi:ferredoxin--NADP+ reductase